MKYKILYDLEAREKDLQKIPQAIRSIIKKAIETKLTVDPYHFGKPLRYDMKGYRSLRVGDYRVIYRIHEEQIVVVIIDIDHRKDVYE